MTSLVILSTGSLFNFDLDTAVALAAEAGYDGLELMIDWRHETQSVSHLQRLIDRHNLPIMAVHSPFTKMVVPGWPDEPVASIKQSVALAGVLGAKIVIVHPPDRWLRLYAGFSLPGTHWKQTIPLPVLGHGSLGHWLLHELPEFQAKTAVKVAVENMPARKLGPLRLNAHHFTSATALSQFQHVTLDTTHVGTRNWDLLAFYRQLATRVAHIHLSDFNGREHQLPGQGWLPLAQLLQLLTGDRFDGLISLELGPHSLQADDQEKLRQNLINSLHFCRKALSVKDGTPEG
jgi:sugar phosphate isomerase/epimerase